MSIFKGISDVFGGISGALNPVLPLMQMGSSLLGSLTEGKSVKAANAANAQQAANEMAFQERMSNTAHQREVEDLRAAGLNPILSANHGASSPGGSMAVFQPDQRGLGDRTNAMFSTASQMATQKSQTLANQASAAASSANAAATIQNMGIKTPQHMLSGWLSNIGQLMDALPGTAGLVSSQINRQMYLDERNRAKVNRRVNVYDWENRR
ncbi:MAG: DNA pilot protein [Arizlama microvirus]|nr:MAG: DNA pilot protein [Arizlama microvirus]